MPVLCGDVARAGGGSLRHGSYGEKDLIHFFQLVWWSYKTIVAALFQPVLVVSCFQTKAVLCCWRLVFREIKQPATF